MPDWMLVWVCLGLLLWLFTLLTNDPATLAPRQWLIAMVMAVAWPFVLIAAVYKMLRP